MRNTLILSTCFVVLGNSLSFAESPKIVGQLPGYKCMMLNLTGEEAMNPATHIPYYSAPSEAAPLAGYAMLQVAVRDPRHEVRGFVEARFPTGSTVWIKAGALTPYHSLGDPTARCVPVMMSNGRGGFDYPHG